MLLIGDIGVCIGLRHSATIVVSWKDAIMQTMPSESAPPGHYGYVGTFSAHRISPYPLPFENAFCCTPESCMDVEVLFLGSGIGLSCAHYLQESALQILGRPLRIVV